MAARSKAPPPPRPDRPLTEAEVESIRFSARVELAKRFAKRKDVLNWGRVLFPEKFTLPFCEELHGYFVSVRHEPLTNTEAPRNHSKTTIKCFLIPIFQVLEEPETFRHYLNVQATGTKALAINVSIRSELENNDVLRAIYGDQFNVERWTDQQFVTKGGVVLTAIGAGQSIRGLNWKNLRPDYIIADDLYDEEDINNSERTKKKNAWFWGSLYPARSKSGRCAVHVQGTAINNDDLLEELKKHDRWKSRTFKAVKDWGSKSVLWPELNSFDDLMADKEEMGSIIFFRELQNERRDDETSIVKLRYLYPTDKPSWEYEPAELLERFDERFLLESVLLLCDPSIGEKMLNDFTGIALTLKTRYIDGGNEFWIEGLWNEHLSQDKRIARLEEIASGLDGGWRAKALEARAEREQREGRRAAILEAAKKIARVSQVRAEGIAGFKDFVAELKRRTSLPVRLIDKVPDKITNLENKSHFFENGKVHVSSRIDKKLRDVLKYQLTTNYPSHDDLRDAVLLGLDDRIKAPGIFVG